LELQLSWWSRREYEEKDTGRKIEDEFRIREKATVSTATSHPDARSGGVGLQRVWDNG
jgi:hypothetical protein